MGPRPHSRSRCSSRLRFACVAGLLAALASALIASGASAAFLAPSFVRQWQLPSPAGGSGVAVDPFGNVFVISGVGLGNDKISKFAHDGVPTGGQWPVPLSGPSGIATDPVGHLHVMVGSQLLEYTNDGAFLGPFRLRGSAAGPIAFDAAGNLYSNGFKGGQRTVNEYHYNGTKWKRIHSAPYPGTPSSKFSPVGFIGLTVDADGGVYGSLTSTTNRSLLKFPASLGGAATFLEDCPSAAPLSCFGGFRLAFTRADVSTTGPEQPVVFAAGGFGGGDSSGFYRMGVYATNGGPAGTSRHLGSYGQQPVPGNFFTNVGAVAASPCHSSVYEQVNIFGNANGTFSGYAIQEFDTHAAATPCATAFTASVKGFAKKYVLAKGARSGKWPCVPCAPVLPSGAFVSRAGARVIAAKRQKVGVRLTFKSSAAADATFLFRRVAGHGPKKKVGGFVYAARAGKNAPRFRGVLRKGRRLGPGVYRVTVSAGQNKRRFKLIVPRRR